SYPSCRDKCSMPTVWQCGKRGRFDLLIKQGSFCPDGHSSCSERIVLRGPWCRTPGSRLDGKAPRRSFDWRGAMLS
ncbi:MAG TPA: hypothetical protein VF961_12055, partial [Pyrinomonadaceae bacterium]